MSDMSKDALFRVSKDFSEAIGLESLRIKESLAVLRANGYHAGMCMLGNSIFTDAPKDVLARLVPDARVIEASSSGIGLSVTRTV